MPLAKSVENQIIDDVVSVLEAITSAADAYYTDPRRVYRMYGNVFELSELPCIVVLPLSSDSDHDCPNGLERIDLRLSISCVMDATENGFMADDYDEVDRVVRNMATDVRKALQADLKRGSRAIDTIIESTDVFEAVQGNPIAAAEIVVRIPFRHQTADPTQAF
jgi:hypothetical protein